MSAQLDSIAEMLTSKKRDVILYGAGLDAEDIIMRLKEHYSVLPSCICDSNPGKWHESLLGVEILSLEEAFSRYPDAYIFISTGIYKYQVIGQLIANSAVAKERIINYEPVVKRKSCMFLESYILCTSHKLYFCCSEFGKNQSPFVAFGGDYELTVQKFIEYRDKLINDLNHGVPTPCDGCLSVKEDWYPHERKIVTFNNGEDGICNFNCCYCRTSARTARDITTDIDTQKLLEIFYKQGNLSEELHTVISCGEICIHPRREAIYNSIRQYRNSICTNASICDPGIMELLGLGNTELIISVDAGTESTFWNIKGRDVFGKVCDNIRSYSQAGDVVLKYILLPGINDNEADIDGFVTLCKEVEVKFVQISFDMFAPQVLTGQAAKAAKYLVNKLAENEINYRIIADVINEAVMKTEETK